MIDNNVIIIAIAIIINEVAIWTVTVHLDFLRYMDCYSPYSRSTVDQLYGR